MRRVFVIAAAGIGLAGCSSFSFDSLKPTPPTVPIALESAPAGAEARTPSGQTCKTPCTLNVPAGEAGLSVTFTMNKFQPVTVPVQVIYNPGDLTMPATTTIEPNPVFADLKPAAPPPKPIRAKPKRPKPKPAASPFPDPNAR